MHRPSCICRTFAVCALWRGFCGWCVDLHELLKKDRGCGSLGTCWNTHTCDLGGRGESSLRFAPRCTRPTGRGSNPRGGLDPYLIAPHSENDVMNNLGGTTPWALALSTVLLVTSVGAQDIGGAQLKKYKSQPDKKKSILLGCPDPGVLCCLPSGVVTVRPSAIDCRSINGEVISYTPQVGDPLFDYPVSFPNTAVFNQWGGCSPVVCCLPIHKSM